MNKENEYIDHVKDRLRVLGYKPLDPDFYNYVYKWLEWYKGYVEEFHKTTVYNGLKFVDINISGLCLAKTFAERWASLLYNDKTQISMKEDDKESNDILHKVLEESHFEERFANTLELAYALGTSATVEYKQLDGSPGINHIYAPMIFPLRYENNEIVDCAFASVNDDSYYLNIHMKQPDGSYKITNDFFKIGKRNKQEEETREDVVREYVSPVKMFQIYKPNIVNKINLFSPFGMSIYANCIDQLKAADYAYDSFVNEFRLGKKKIFLPIGTLSYKIVSDDRGKTTSVPLFDENQTEYYALPGDENNKDVKIDEYNPQIRISEHLEGIQLAVNLAGMNAGFGENYFTFKDGKVYTNTTQVISSNSELYKNIVKNEKMLRSSLIELAKAIYYVATGKIYESDVSVNFDDSVIEDSEAKKNQAILELNNELIDPIQYYIDVYGMSEKQALQFRKKVLERLAKETKNSPKDDKENEEDQDEDDNPIIDEDEEKQDDEEE